MPLCFNCNQPLEEYYDVFPNEKDEYVTNDYYYCRTCVGSYRKCPECKVGQLVMIIGDIEYLRCNTCSNTECI